MKKLTIEQKAKAYDEAIERAKKLQETCDSTDVVGWCEYIFPKLCEPEDEKIVNAIRKALESKIEDLGNGVTRTACLAWLKKQGGQKSTEWDEYDEMYVNALVAIVRKRGATDERLRDELIGWLSCLKCRLGE